MRIYKSISVCVLLIVCLSCSYGQDNSRLAAYIGYGSHISSIELDNIEGQSYSFGVERSVHFSERYVYVFGLEMTRMESTIYTRDTGPASVATFRAGMAFSKYEFVRIRLGGLVDYEVASSPEFYKLERSGLGGEFGAGVDFSINEQIAVYGMGMFRGRNLLGFSEFAEPYRELFAYAGVAYKFW